MKSTELSRHYRSLELPKILKMLENESPCQACAEMAGLLVPSTSLEAVQRLLAETNDAHMLIARFGGPSFGGLKNIDNALTRASAGACLSMPELLSVAGVLRIMRGILQWRDHSSGVSTCLDGLFASLTSNKYLETKITSAILSEDEMSDNASPELARIHRKITACSSRIREQLDKLIRSATTQKFLQDPIVTIRSDRFVVPVKAEHKNDVPGLVHDTSSSGATLFVEPMGAVEANNEIRVLKAREAEEIERILFELSGEAGSFAEPIKQSYAVSIELALIFTKAHLAYKMKATLPIVADNGIIHLHKARHPLIDPTSVVPTDIQLGSEFDTLVITGPNTGGKTVTLKTIGLLTLMAMCGLMIPASENSRLSIFDHILSDIGDEQSIEQSLSTFSAHMTNIIEILGVATSKSLVLMDELGAGTDPVEGAALAISILENLRGKGAKIAATTHYAELKSYAISTSGVENGCCEFDIKTLRPTYRLLIGIPGRSNAFAISERLGLSNSVVERAKALVSGENMQFEEVVEHLQQSRQSFEEQKEEIEQLKITAQRAAFQAKTALERLERERDRELEQARVKARQIVVKARMEAEMIVDELDMIKRKQQSDQFGTLAAKAKSELRGKLEALEALADPVAEQDRGEYVLPRALKIGDTVLIASLNAKGSVIGLVDKSGNIEVQAGIIKTRVPLTELRLIEGQKPKSYQGTLTRNVKQNVVSGGKAEIDLRGMASDEAIMRLDSFIDASVLSGLHQITIIHGKGTGVLRNAIGQHLRNHPSIRIHRLGVYGEGENGVTIAELK